MLSDFWIDSSLKIVELDTGTISDPKRIEGRATLIQIVEHAVILSTNGNVALYKMKM